MYVIMHFKNKLKVLVVFQVSLETDRDKGSEKIVFSKGYVVFCMHYSITRSSDSIVSMDYHCYSCLCFHVYIV